MRPPPPRAYTRLYVLQAWSKTLRDYQKPLTYRELVTYAEDLGGVLLREPSLQGAEHHSWRVLAALGWLVASASTSTWADGADEHTQALKLRLAATIEQLLEVCPSDFVVNHGRWYHSKPRTTAETWAHEWFSASADLHHYIEHLPNHREHAL